MRPFWPKINHAITVVLYSANDFFSSFFGLFIRGASPLIKKITVV